VPHSPDFWTEAERIGVLLACPRSCDESVTRPAIEALDGALDAEVVILRPHVQPVGRLRSVVLGMATLHLDAAVIFTPPGFSPYPIAYVSYLAGIQERIGLSREFGGSLLTRWVLDQNPPLPEPDRYVYLLRAAGLPLPAEIALKGAEAEWSRSAS
jgi:hypothetical protein